MNDKGPRDIVTSDDQVSASDNGRHVARQHLAIFELLDVKFQLRPIVAERELQIT